MAKNTPPRREHRKAANPLTKGKKVPGYQAKVDTLANQIAADRSKARAKVR